MDFFKTKGSNQHITVYQVKKGRQWRKIAYKTISKQLFVLGWLLAALFWHQAYVVTCSAGGHFMTRSQCDELATNKGMSLEVARLQVLNNNPDLQ